jgi:hypothetical protein
MVRDHRPLPAWGVRTLSTGGLTTSHINISTKIPIDPEKVNFSEFATRHRHDTSTLAGHGAKSRCAMMVCAMRLILRGWHDFRKVRIERTVQSLCSRHLSYCTLPAIFGIGLSFLEGIIVLDRRLLLVLDKFSISEIEIPTNKTKGAAHAAAAPLFWLMRNIAVYGR